ncbi:flagellar basal body P-ring formation protein FlgA [Paracoccus versutus]|uniref:Flagella basal body P-ring formation protein FlgA n=1 Tax=Paracoccus versutus TaxID=34007 RepID=A0A099EZ56_PARVE|nr:MULTISPECIES: flagellar basal body P-ring formation chaperone FlgA [Paracoccus]WGR60048.1 flagellar basal body P-ring formation protein FlgA [Paracoccus ferrooxidans]SFY40821.1 flagella basal body P-ring formation protein FlgA [Paracoccus pantotrophus]KGJ03263.1 flagellar basal body P-ring biosynthesis protein FlgA [Paracoccus versutus]MCJ1902727.1 flagellar basal body P-ring formation protein FlgA [Paracoccus versutus]MDF3906390.1 flagellar basal body P-ring formation chaperone FlgA [Parac
MRGLVLLLMLLPQGVLAGSVVANRTLPAGTVIAAGDVTLVPDQQGGIEDLAPVLGQQLRVMVYQGRRIDPSALTAPTLVGRNQIVTIAYEKAALRIEAEGRALSAGSAGQVIRVMNNASRVTVSGRVAPDGTVIVRQN